MISNGIYAVDIARIFFGFSLNQVLVKAFDRVDCFP